MSIIRQRDYLFQGLIINCLVKLQSFTVHCQSVIDEENDLYLNDDASNNWHFNSSMLTFKDVGIYNHNNTVNCDITTT